MKLNVFFSVLLIILFQKSSMVFGQNASNRQIKSQSTKTGQFKKTDYFTPDKKPEALTIESFSLKALKDSTLFFQGDSLLGFDFSTAHERAQFENVQLFSEYKVFMLQEQIVFVKNKYSINRTRYEQSILPSENNSAENTISKISQTSLCNNVDFEDGDLNGWKCQVGYNANSNGNLTITSNNFGLGTDATLTDCYDYSLITSTYGKDQICKFKGIDSLSGGTYALRIGSYQQNLNSTVTGLCLFPRAGYSGFSNGEMISKTIQVTQNNSLLILKYAVVLVDGGHPKGKMPYFQVKVTPQTGPASPCGNYYIQAEAGVVPQKYSATNYNGSPVYYRKWISSVLNLTPYIGSTVNIDFIVAGCTLGAHSGYAYIDGACASLSEADIKETKLCNKAVYTAPSLVDVTYSWSGPNGGIIGPNNTATVSVQTAGNYTLTITPQQGNSCSFDLIKTYTPAPLTTLSLSSNAANNNFCLGLPVTLTANATTTVSYHWMPGNYNTAFINPPLTTSGIQTFTCTVNDGICPPISKSISVNALSLPTVSSSVITAANCGLNAGSISQININGGTPNYQYSWDKGSTWLSTAQLNNLSIGTYTLIVKDSYGCESSKTFIVPGGPNTIVASIQSSNHVSCYGLQNGSITINATGGASSLTYQWQPAYVTSTNNTATNLIAGTYTCIISDSLNCKASVSAILTQPVSPLISGIGAISPANCYGNATGTVSILATGGTPGYQYSWLPNVGTGSNLTNLAAGTYTCVVSDQNGCTTSHTVQISQPSLPLTLNVQQQQNIKCHGDHTGSIHLAANGGTPAYLYNWTPGISNSDKAKNLSAGLYLCTVTDFNGCVAAQSVQITEPQKLLVQLSSDTVCFGYTNTIQATTIGGVSPFHYKWTPTAIDSAIITSSYSGQISLSVIDGNNCQYIKCITPNRYPLPLTYVTSNANNNTLILTENGGDLCFYDHTQAGMVWNWLLNDGRTSNLQNPCFEMKESGNYCANLTVKTQYGCLDSTHKCAYVEISPSIFPNVFTPNEDNINSLFQIITKAYSDLHCSIYDRWGILLYEWDGVNGGWDGRDMAGREAVDGIYYWSVVLKNENSKDQVKNGTVLLIR